LTDMQKRKERHGYRENAHQKGIALQIEVHPTRRGRRRRTRYVRSIEQPLLIDKGEGQIKSFRKSIEMCKKDKGFGGLPTINSRVGLRVRKTES